jgi:hypothetical protein
MAFDKGFWSCGRQKSLQPWQRSPVHYLHLAGLDSRYSAFEGEANSFVPGLWMSNHFADFSVAMISRSVACRGAAAGQLLCAGVWPPQAGAPIAWQEPGSARPRTQNRLSLGQRNRRARRELILSYCFHTACAQAAICFAPSRDLAPGLGHLGRQTFPGPEDLCGKFAVELTNLLRLSDKVR